MLYAILCYNSEEEVFAWSKEHDAEVMGRLQKVHDKLEAQGRMGPAARLMPTTAATTLHKSDPPMVVDGPFVETKEQLLGFYTVDVDSLEDALDIARELTAANPGAGGYEVRPVLLYVPGGETIGRTT